MVTKLEIYNGAITFLGTQRLDSTNGLTENVAARYELDNRYDAALAYMLEQGLWKFALRASKLTYDDNIDTEFGLQYAFSIPSDFVRLAGISTDGHFRPGTEPDYGEENGYWFSDSSEIYVKYVSNDANYGLNLSAYPQNYVEALCSWLAYKTVLPVSKDRGDRNTILQQHNMFLSASKRLDAVDEGVKSKPPGRWTQARTGSRGPTFSSGRMRF